MKNRNRLATLVLALVSVCSLSAQTAVIPDAAAMTASVTAIGGIAGAAAALGFSIWLYRKVKAKAGQAIG